MRLATLSDMAYRTFRDASGVEWQVWEVHPTLAERRVLRERRAAARGVPERRIRNEPRTAVRNDLRYGWLAFRSRVERRRRAPIPPGWEAFSDEELSEVLERAERIPEHGGPAH
jgi:hypothetical protein